MWSVTGHLHKHITWMSKPAFIYMLYFLMNIRNTKCVHRYFPIFMFSECQSYSLKGKTGKYKSIPQYITYMHTQQAASTYPHAFHKYLYSAEFS